MPEAIARYLPDNLSFYLAEHEMLFPWLYLALTIAFIIWMIKELAVARLKSREDFIRIGKELGFTPLPSGFINFDVCDMRAMRRGMEVSLYITQGVLENTPAFIIDVMCFIRNPLGVSLVAYPAAFIDLKKLSDTQPPVVENVPYWDWYTVRGEPAETVRETLSEARKNSGTVFQEKWGFSRMELYKGRFRCLFKSADKPDMGQLKKMTDESVEIAVRFSGK
jgi:hypothetical protein